MAFIITNSLPNRNIIKLHTRVMPNCKLGEHTLALVELESVATRYKHRVVLTVSMGRRLFKGMMK